MRVKDGVLVLHTMRWPDEIRRPDFAFLDEDITVRPQELKMAESLISSMTGDFDPTEFSDDYREALTALLEAKQSGGDVQQVPDVPDSGAAVVDLMSALRRSVERARGGSAEDAGDSDSAEESPAAEAPAKRAPAKKAPAKGLPAKKAPAKKAPAKKAAAAKKTTATKAAASKATPGTTAAPGKTTTPGTTTAAKKTTADKPPAKRARRSA
jgi:DNA end-binding protein Ku